jgi:hypothetical protein
VLCDPDYKVPASWTLSEEAPRLPRSVAMFNDGHARSWDFDKQQAVVIPYQPPYHRGFLYAALSVTSVTNVGRLTLPTGAIFQEFAMAPTGRINADVSVKRSITMSVRQACDHCALVDFRPHVENKTVVQDRRLLHANPAFGPVTYDLQESQWPTVEQVRAMAARRQEK